MRSHHVLVTGSSGLIGSEAVRYFDSRGRNIIGIDNNLRREFFGPPGDTTWNLDRLKTSTRNFRHYALDIRDREGVMGLFEQNALDLVIHCAAQPSHDKAKDIPLIDFEVNALGTMNLLEATRRHAPDAVFIMMSTNKVYGDSPNEKRVKEIATRWEYADPEDFHGIDETCRIDQSLHSIFGASKVAADVMAQEYGRYFGLKVGVFRGGCLTGPNHSGVQMHGFLSYLVKVAVTGEPYTVYGYKGKQVRDNIHSYDVIRAMEEFAGHPRPGEVYNLGGGRANSVSVIEAIDRVEQLTGHKLNWNYSDQNRVGDHICYISDLSKLKSHCPDWTVTRSLDDILQQMVAAQVAHSAVS